MARSKKSNENVGAEGDENVVQYDPMRSMSESLRDSMDNPEQFLKDVAEGFATGRGLPEGGDYVYRPYRTPNFVTTEEHEKKFSRSAGNVQSANENVSSGGMTEATGADGMGAVGSGSTTD